MEISPHQRLSAQQRERYSRQILLPSIGVPGQKRLQQARIAIVGAGGLGSNVAMALAAAGVGYLRIIDPDPLELSNLHRQVLYRATDVGEPKVLAAQNQLRQLNNAAEVNSINCRLSIDNAKELFESCSLVIDGSDNFTTRSAINQACGQMRLPWVHGAAEALSGQLSVFWPNKQPGQYACYHCLYPQQSLTEEGGCHRRGVLGMVPSIIAQLQAVEAVKIITGWGQPLYNTLVQYEAESAGLRRFRFNADPSCSCSQWKSANRGESANRETSK